MHFLELWKNDKSFGNQYLEMFFLTELEVSNKKCGKHNLKCLRFLKIWKNDKSWGNQYLEMFYLTELGIPNKKYGKLGKFAYSLKSEKMTNHVETNTQNIFVWQSWVYQTKSMENITWKICNFLKSEKMTSLVESNTLKNFVWQSSIMEYISSDLKVAGFKLPHKK